MSIPRRGIPRSFCWIFGRRCISSSTGRLAKEASQAMPVNGRISSIVPTKSVMQRILFDLNSPITYKQALPIFESALRDNELKKLPRYADKDSLMILKQALETYRKLTKTISKPLVRIESVLVETSAELGNCDAIALLAIETLSVNSTTRDDKMYAKVLLKQLVDKNHPLVFKLLADIAFLRLSSAVETDPELLSISRDLYLKHLELDKKSIAASESHKNLGLIYFNHTTPPDVHLASTHFQLSLSLAYSNTPHVAEAHYYLSLTKSPLLAKEYSDPLKCRYHLEQAASKGFSEAFYDLGVLELHIFQDYVKAVEWLKLGLYIGHTRCMLSLFDAYIKSEKWLEASEIIRVIKGRLEAQNGVENGVKIPTWPEFYESRRGNIHTAVAKGEEIKKEKAKSAVGSSEEKVEQEKKQKEEEKRHVKKNPGKASIWNQL